MPLSANMVKTKAQELGFNLVGITRAAPSPFLAAYERWVEAGMHGGMGYLARPDRLARRRDLNVILPGVRSLLVVGYDYAAAAPQDLLQDPARGRIASYAWGVDYHDVMLPKLETLADWIDHTIDIADGRTTHRAYVDTGAILERGHAYAAGMGFVGKNTMLIHPRRGSYFFLGELLLTHEFDAYDEPGRPTMCGRCTRCLNACPTDAFPQPHVLDARRCISYLTIEHKSWIERDLRPRMGNWVFGCDVCQEVCPFQRFAEGRKIANADEAFLVPTESPGVGTRRASSDLALPNMSPDAIAPPLLDLLALTPTRFAACFAGTPIARIGRDRLVRNACVAAGNWGSAEVLPALIALLVDESPLVRGHAAWALGRIGGAGARDALETALRDEADGEVRQEIGLAWAG